MQENIQIIDPTKHKGWDGLLLLSPYYSFFHSSAWAKVLQETYRYTPTYFTIIDNEKIEALVPVMQVSSILTGERGVSLPFTDYSDPIISNGAFPKSLFNYIIQYGKNHDWKSVELRGGQNFTTLSPISCTYSRHILDLCRDADDIFSRFRGSTRRNIKKAIKKGVTVEVLNTLDSLKEFHRLNLITRKRHGLPPQPLFFFEKVYQHVISKNLGIVVLASYENNIVAGAVFFNLGEKAIFKYGASDKDFHHLRPNNLVMWEAIKWYSENGYKRICLGRTEPGNEGLRRFKAGWGAKEKVERYYKYSYEKNGFMKDSAEIKKIYRHVFRKMPLPFLSLIGSLLYRHVG
jgi:hypothetical protein